MGSIMASRHALISAISLLLHEWLVGHQTEPGAAIAHPLGWTLERQRFRIAESPEYI
jgi:hypothetical protein